MVIIEDSISGPAIEKSREYSEKEKYFLMSKFTGALRTPV